MSGCEQRHNLHLYDIYLAWVRMASAAIGGAVLRFVRGHNHPYNGQDTCIPERHCWVGLYLLCHPMLVPGGFPAAKKQHAIRHKPANGPAGACQAAVPRLVLHPTPILGANLFRARDLPPHYFVYKTALGYDFILLSNPSHKLGINSRCACSTRTTPSRPLHAFHGAPNETAHRTPRRVWRVRYALPPAPARTPAQSPPPPLTPPSKATSCLSGVIAGS